MLKKAFWLSVCLVFGACAVIINFEEPGGPFYEGHFAPNSAALRGPLKIVSYNIELGKKVSQAVSDLRDIPELEEADIVLLQEMDSEGVEALARELNYNYIYYPACVHIKNRKDYGNAVLSKWLITSSHKVILPHKHPFRKQIRIAVFAEIQIGSFEILGSSVHTEVEWLNQKERMDQLETIIMNIPADAAHVVVGGDFNTLNLASVRRAEKIFRQAGFIRLSKGVGPTSKYDPTGLFGPELDHIFARGMPLLKNGKAKSARASDHYPIWDLVVLSESH